ncbi:MAG TPA: hypothetical protein VK610_00095, partial [Rhodothermales bacterium]|nr:hypothetical protein [Rhodothermales bacterium]
MRFPLLALLLVLAVPARGQDRTATERRLTTLRSQIEATERQVGQARTEEAGALAAVEGIETEIQLRETLVAAYATRLDSARTEAEALRGSVHRLEQEIASARQSYRRRVRHAYMRGRMSDLALVLSAGSISQALARVRYLRRFAQARRRQIERIAVRTEELRAREQTLEGTLRETQSLLTASRSERAALAERRVERERLVAEVRRRRAGLEEELAQRRTDADALEGVVRDLVSAERRRVEEEAARAAEEE